MIPPNTSASLPESEIIQQYYVIINKLQNTLAKHQTAFPQLLVLEEILNVDFSETMRDEDYLKRLEEICSYLNTVGVGSYIIRHLHHYLCADVELVKYKTFFLIDQGNNYLELPR